MECAHIRPRRTTRWPALAGIGPLCMVVLGMVASMALVHAHAGAQSAETPGPPRSIETSPGNRSISVSWRPPTSDGGADVTSYVVRHKQSSADDEPASWTEVAHSDLADLAAVLPALTEWTPHDVEIAAVNSVGRGDWSTKVQAVPNRDIKLPPRESDPQGRVARTAGLWSDSTTLWVAGNDYTTALAYTLATGERDAAKDRTLGDDVRADGNTCSNGDTVWLRRSVPNSRYGGHLEAFDAQTGNPQPSLDIPVPESEMFQALWCDSDSMRMMLNTPSPVSLRAYTLPDGDRDPRNDVVGIPRKFGTDAMWVDDTTIWLVHSGSTISAYGTNGWRRPSLDIHMRQGGGTVSPAHPKALWSDGATMWVGDYEYLYERVFSYRLPQAADGPPELWSATVSTDGSSVVLGFDEELDTNVVPDPARFMVKVGDAPTPRRLSRLRLWPTPRAMPSRSP